MSITLSFILGFIVCAIIMHFIFRRIVDKANEEMQDMQKRYRDRIKEVEKDFN